MNRSYLILTTSPLSQTAKKHRGTANLARRQRLLYGRKRCNSTVKERDMETGLYYYGARYLNSRTGRWISGDPAMGDYVPEAPVDDEARKRNGNLPGMGGVFNYVNLHVYHYAGNNPVKYFDPDGEDLVLTVYKSTGKMSVTRTPSENSPASSRNSVTFRSMDVVTNVNRDSPDAFNTIASDTTRSQKSGAGYTNPTQMADGTYPLIEARAPTTGNGEYGEGDQGILIGITQFLPGVYQKNPKELDGIIYQDTGYMIHITPHGNTNGCIGIRYDPKDPQSRAEAVAKMEYIVNQYKDAIKNGEKARIIVVE